MGRRPIVLIMYASSPTRTRIFTLCFFLFFLLILTSSLAAAQITSCGNAVAANGTVAGRTGNLIYLLNCTTGSNAQGYTVNSASLELGTTVAGSIEAAVYNADVTA